MKHSLHHLHHVYLHRKFSSSGQNRIVCLFVVCIAFLSFTNFASGQNYRPERWQDGRELRQGKFLLGAGWGTLGVGFTTTPATVISVPALEPELKNNAFGSFSVGGMVGVAPHLDLGLEIGGTQGGWMYSGAAKYAFLPYSSPFQAAAMFTYSYSAAEIRYGPSSIDSLIQGLFRVPVIAQQKYLLRANMSIFDLSVPLSYDISPEWSLLLAPRIMWASYYAGIGDESIIPNGLSSVSLIETGTNKLLYGFSIGAKAVRESPQWWQYLLPVPFLASGAMQLSFTWAHEERLNVTLSYQNLFPSFGTLLTTVSQEEMDNIESERRQKDSILTEQKRQIEIERTRFGRALSAEIIGIKGIDSSGSIVENPTMRVEEFDSEESLAILPAVFFEHNSHVIPARYRRIRSADRFAFTTDNLARFKPAEAYRNILNIIGKRMSDISTATLTVRGTTSGFGEEAANEALAERRAHAVMDYLIEVWKISPTRFTIQTLAKADTVGLRGEFADFSRVELSSSSESILAPIESRGIMRRTMPERIQFGFDIAAGAGLKQWNFELTQMEGTEVRTLKTETGRDASINQYTWVVGETQASVPTSGENIAVRLEITDLTNRVAESSLALVPVDYISLQQKQRSRASDTKIYRLQTWIWGSLDANFAQSSSAHIPEPRIMSEIRRKFPPTSTLRIPTQLSKEQELSLQQGLSRPVQFTRTKSSASLSTLVLPEERIYARTVSMEIREPVLAKQ